jgi:PIN domain nuclease of toxin-antitoxin system
LRGVLLDTHALVWNLHEPRRLGARARSAIEGATDVLVSPISFFEIGQRVRLGKWPDVSARLPDLQRVFRERGGAVARLDVDICLAAAALDWPHRDPFDRMIAATCLAEGLTLVSADVAFDGLGGLARVW